jgi:dTDP-4-dehydrorhamnose 3,5-epimerase
VRPRQLAGAVPRPVPGGRLPRTTLPSVEIRELSVPGAFSLHPRQHVDDRGLFLEWYRHETLTDEIGHPLRLAQANCSVSRRGTVRGIHFADVPPGQAKYVCCAAGAVLDIVVDLRVGSPTFGQWDSVRLDATDRAAVYLSEGLGHAFAALTDGATVMYLCSEVYHPAGEHGITPLDPGLAITWPKDLEPVLSAKDAAAPTLAAAATAGLLPDYGDCLKFYDASRDLQ